MAQLNTTCPKCGAPHARKLSVIHAEGLSSVQTNIETVGTFNTIGRQQIKTKGTASGTQQTQASKDAAPPEVPEPTTLGLMIRIGGMLSGMALCIGGFFTDSTAVAVIGMAAIVGSFFVPTAPTEKEQREHDEATKHLRAAKEAWANTFQCSACGERFVAAEILTP